MTLTKSWLQKQITDLEATRDEIPLGLDEDGNNTLAALKLALAGMEAAEKKTVEIPTFDGYVPHVARELQAAFRIACDNAGINVADAAGKGEAS